MAPTSGRSTRGGCGRCAAHRRGVPEPGAGAQPADGGRGVDRRAAPDPHPPQGRRARPCGHAGDGRRGPARGVQGPAAAPALWRPVPAGRDRSRPLHPSRTCSCSTSPPRRSTSPCRPRSSTCCGSSGRARNLTYLLISHDLDVVGYMSDHVAVMYRGQVVEEGPVESVLTSPQHDYTTMLLASKPGAGRGNRNRAGHNSALTTRRRTDGDRDSAQGEPGGPRGIPRG